MPESACPRTPRAPWSSVRRGADQHRVAQAGDPVQMAAAFAQAVEAGRSARLAGPIEPRDLAAPSTPVIGTAFRG